MPKIFDAIFRELTSEVWEDPDTISAERTDKGVAIILSWKNDQMMTLRLSPDEASQVYECLNRYFIDTALDALKGDA